MYLLSPNRTPSSPLCSAKQPLQHVPHCCLVCSSQLPQAHTAALLRQQPRCPHLAPQPRQVSSQALQYVLGQGVLRKGSTYCLYCLYCSLTLLLLLLCIRFFPSIVPFITPIIPAVTL